MTDLLAALGVALVLEGAAYALFPDPMRRAMAVLFQQTEKTVRTAGLTAALFGLILVWLARMTP